MVPGFRENVGKKRGRMKFSNKLLNDRISNAPFGDKTKELARKWSEYESFGGVGWGVFEVTPVIERGEGAYLYDADGKSYCCIFPLPVKPIVP